jgi:hypothetical protein
MTAQKASTWFALNSLPGLLDARKHETLQIQMEKRPPPLTHEVWVKNVFTVFLCGLQCVVDLNKGKKEGREAVDRVPPRCSKS